MATARTTIDYIKPNLEIYGPHLERYANTLREGGKSKCGTDYVRHRIHSFLARCPPTQPGDVTADLMSEVSATMESDGIGRSLINGSMIHMGRFLKFITGTDPYMEIDPDSKAWWFEGHVGEFLFEEELEVFLQHLRHEGFSERCCTRRKKGHITSCVRVLNKEMGVTRIDQIDGRCIAHISGLVSGLYGDTARNVLYDLDEFVRFTVGRSPLQEFRRIGADHPTYEDTDEWRDFTALLDGYIRDQTERGLRPKSIEGITLSIRKAYRTLVEEFGPVFPKDIDYHHIRHLRNSMRDLKQITVQTYLGRLGKMLEFAYGTNPYRQADLVWAPETVERPWIFKEQWNILWGSADVTEKLILALGGGMGLRRVEITRIRLTDINDGVLTIRGKGHGPEGRMDERRIPPTVMRCIEDYMAIRDSIVKKYGDHSGGALMVMDSIKKGGAITSAFVNRRIHRLVDKTRIHVTCHTLRRFYCMALVDAGTEIDTVRLMMRHESAQTTYENYIYADPRKLAMATKTVEGAVFG